MDIRDLSLPEAEARRDGLAALLHDCVHGGASVNFILPFPIGEARAFWTGKAFPVIAQGKRQLWVAEEGGRIAGCVMLDRDTPPNQAHRGDVTKMLVHPHFRRRGLGRDLLGVLIAAARDHGLSLLTLDTVSGSPAQGLYEGAGFVVAGEIPDFALSPNGTRLEPTTYMFRHL